MGLILQGKSLMRLLKVFIVVMDMGWIGYLKETETIDQHGDIVLRVTFCEREDRCDPSEGRSSVYVYLCNGEDGLFTVPVEWRYHMRILESEGDPRGREIEYDDDIDPPVLRFLN